MDGGQIKRQATNPASTLVIGGCWAHFPIDSAVATEYGFLRFGKTRTLIPQVD